MRLNLFSKKSPKAKNEQTFNSPFVIPDSLTAEDVENCKVYANRIDALKTLPQQLVIAEVGVLFGDLTEIILSELAPKKVDCFDIFTSHTFEEIWGKKSAEIFNGMTHEDYFVSKFKPLIQSGDVRVYSGDSSTNLSLSPDKFYDAIYLDGDHTYEGVVKDSKIAVSKVKDDGYLIFNDYTMYDHRAKYPYGVVQVVNDLVRNKGWKFHYLALHNEMFMDVCLVKK
jgi:hypothetical protein